MATLTNSTEVTAADSVRMLIDAWAQMTSRFRGSSFAGGGGVASTYANRPLSFFNLSTLDQPLVTAAHFRSALALARARAADCPHPSLLAQCDDWSPPDWEDLAAEEGWLRSMTLIGMATDQLRPGRRAEPGLDYRLIDDPGAGLQLGLVNALAYAMAPASFDCMSEMSLWGEGAFGVVGYDVGRPVTAAATFLVRDVIYVAMVASVPGLQGRGYGEAAMRRAIAHAQCAVGDRTIWLHASEAGAPLYREMGFGDGPALTMLHLATP